MWAPEVWGDSEVEVSHNTRLKCAFVDYLNNDWTIGEKAITKYNLTSLIEKLGAHIKLEK